MMAFSDNPPSFCLSGEVAGVTRSYLLAPGDNRVGSLESNDIVLPVFGVSREHAIICCDADGLAIKDLDSKNGTFVNGVRVHHGALSAGDRVCFGPAELVFAPLPAEEAALAISFDIPAPETGSSASWEETGTVASNKHECTCETQLGLLECVLGRMARLPGGDPAAALSLLISELGSPGGCLVEWSEQGEPVQVAGAIDVDAEVIAGDLNRQLERAMRKSRATEYWTVSRIGNTEQSCAVLSSPGRLPLALLLDTEPEALSGSAAVLRAFMRVVLLLRSHKPRSQEAPREDAGPQLLFPAGYVVGESPAMVSLYEQMRLLLRGRVPVLLVGETGVGKEHLARILHASCELAEGPFVAVNCAAIPADLLEAEMFGIGKGVATGVAERRGKFQQAHGGTLFLDEIGEMSPGLQAKLLRALQGNEVRPLGGETTRVDMRVITATNMDLLQRIEQGAFRRDLYYRIAGYLLQVPPLRCRTEDLLPLIEHFLRLYAAENGKQLRGISVGAVDALGRYSWPGNVRELANEVRRLVYMCSEGQAIISDLVAKHILEAADDVRLSQPQPTASDLELKSSLAQVEDRLIRRALTRTGGNRTEAARLLGITRNGLAIKMKRLGIDLRSE